MHAAYHVTSCAQAFIALRKALEMRRWDRNLGLRVFTAGNNLQDGCINSYSM